jgi:exopolyphosphatase / guanosine-5'-triphosphate,3'-diphosphate pyrophosphatase
MKRIATLDIGTNTALLLIADLDFSTKSLTTVFNAQEIIRLGKGVDADGGINADGALRLIECLKKYKIIIEQYGVTDVFAVGTSALRDAKNRDEIVETVRRESGISIETVSGADEAELTFLGAVAGWTNLPDKFLVIDIGGGSTELVLGTVNGIDARISIDIGSVRLTERLFKHTPPLPIEFEEAELLVTDAFAEQLPMFIAGRESAVGVAGTAVTIAQLAKGLQTFSPELHGYNLQYADVHRLLEKFRQSSVDEIVSLGVDKGRADVITAGTLILHQFMRLFSAKQLTVSIQGLRYGIALRELQNTIRQQGAV